MQIDRRTFLKKSTLAGTFTIVPSYVLGARGQTPPSGKLNIAGVGVGGMGGGNLKAMEKTENIVALCDVDSKKAAHTFQRYPQAKTFKDYRVMLEKMDKQIDAVVVATPDHTHACVAMEAMRRGKHVYVQKPLTRTVHEARTLTEAARKYGVVTQMGNQGHSGEGIRLVYEWIEDGAIGDVHEVHAFTSRPVWPQGLPTPKEGMPVPEGLDWDLFLGPAPYRPYHRVYHPWDWRAWWDFGTGALGDMACHILDPVFWALKLKYPTSVEGTYARMCPEKWKPQKYEDSFPPASIVRYTFPAREGMPEVKLSWFDGGLMPPRPAALEDSRRMGDSDGGVVFYGDKGTLMCGCYGKSPQLLPYPVMKAYKKPPKKLKRIETSHEMNWVECCKSGKKASSHFDYAGPFTETVVMGNLAIRFPNKKLLWDGANMRVTNLEAANALVNPPYRDGWTL